MRCLLYFFAALPLAAESDAFLTNARQLTLSGRRAGEGYFSADGKRMIFQSEREAANPFYQIYLLEFESGDIRRLSDGTGKTTCAWLLPDNKSFLYASTHEDRGSAARQEAELKDRAAGTQKRYAWDYDENYDLFLGSLDGKAPVNLTKVRGYDAEGSVSPDGKWIVFASNRHAYGEPLEAAAQERFERQKSWLMDIYVMSVDGSQTKRLTDVPGYDGGPFFSADGKRICWRRFNEEEDKAEIWTMNPDGSDQQQITKLGAMSWAPFFHPSGQYLIFGTNRHGFDNFELYMVDAAGKHEPVRITNTEGFDGLPVFTPDGARLSWTSNRTADRISQIFMADWDHAGALAALGLGDAPAAAAATPAPAPESFKDDISADDLRGHVTYLASDALEGRGTGTRGEALATGYVTNLFKAWGLEPAGPEWLHAFEFTAGVDLGPENRLTVTGSSNAAPAVRSDWSPLTFSSTGEIPSAGVVFAGYGLEIPEERGSDGKPLPGYSSYFHLDVKDKWVVMFRYTPENITQDQRVRYARYSSLRFKAMTARQKGARGILLVSGPNAKVVQQLVPLSFDSSMATSGIAALSITDALAASLLQSSGKDLKALQDELDGGEQSQGFELKDVTMAASIDVKQEKRTGHNVVGLLRGPANSTEPALVIGAHIDHLGTTAGSDSRASDAERHTIHHGADDNASGVAAMLEIAQAMAAQQKAGTLKLTRNVIFAGWSGEEIGLLGSNAWCRDLAKFTGDENAKLGNQLCANLNLDMVGRLGRNLMLQGTGSSDWWAGEIEKRNVVTGLPVQMQADSYLPTDASTFYLRGVPILSAFTGSHDDYHKPSDTADKVNYDGAAKITRLMMLIGRTLATGTEEPALREMAKPAEGPRGGLRAYLGTVPDYAQDGVQGVKLSGVSAIGPAAKAGVLAGDIIVKLAGKDVNNIYDYTFVMGALKIGQETEMDVMRGGKRVTLKITPGSRE
jgi:Tol biopolymer transport system component